MALFEQALEDGWQDLVKTCALKKEISGVLHAGVPSKLRAPGRPADPAPAHGAAWIGGEKGLSVARGAQ